MDRTDWFLAFITFLLAVITLETVSNATNELFREIGGGASIVVIYFLPLYLLGHAVMNRSDD
ncbi:hypothetical protein [Haloarcula salina]|uniref:Uncharacterized protein n=1 Tax=Haloarcula salina TaxID=1429914 RepID=A0AA41FXS9_9EURY|nr:hypothetical protein [Haloarcula salina]MBV0900770.1 hypothetical protein [Haloarcula salina]